mmetsp:Transcript_10268/g.25555  ORF Transcript_10268/g.25555 Transcript_10268/m.25555 type:complete len:315 (-) Transcript_10268:124-1068(-)
MLCNKAASVVAPQGQRAIPRSSNALKRSHRRADNVIARAQEQRQPVMELLAAAVVTMSAMSGNAGPAMAEEARLPRGDIPETVYFGNGCFWGRQFDFVNTEKKLGRTPDEISALVGYAGGQRAGPDGKVCYYLSDPRTVYERLGHAEVVQLALSTDSTDKATQEFRTFADTYFKQFRRTDAGMQRLDPQDAGPGYRNVIGLPGGVSSPLFKVLQDANVNGMELREGKGGAWEKVTRQSQEAIKVGSDERINEDDLLNVVWVVDSTSLPFYRAERYHQFHTGIGKLFPKEYLWDLKNTAAANGKIGSTGCPELPF